MTDNAFDVPCHHATVALDGESEWRCTNCESLFIPAANVQALVEDAERQIDLAVNVASETASRVLRGMGFARPEPPTEAEEEDHRHAWDDDDKCALCEAPRFLGGGN